MQRPALHRRTAPARGFTLVELIVVVSILAIVGALAMPAAMRFSSSRSAVAAKQVLRDLSHARERALVTGIRTWVHFDAAANSYTVMTEQIGAAGRAAATPLPDPAGAGPYKQQLNAGEFAGVSITRVAFDSGPDIGFDWLGKPLNGGSSALASDGSVTLTGPATITVKAGTGLVTTP